MPALSWHWPDLSRREKTAALRKVLSFKKNSTATGREIREQYFTGVTHTGLITHTWRHGPALPNARTHRRRRVKPFTRRSRRTAQARSRRGA